MCGSRPSHLRLSPPFHQCVDCRVPKWLLIEPIMALHADHERGIQTLDSQAGAVVLGGVDLDS